MVMSLAKVFHRRYYWDNVQHKAVILQKVRGDVKVDVRNFFVNPHTHELQKIVASCPYFTDDYKAKWCLEWVAKNIAALPDKHVKDVWKLPFEVLSLHYGDCEDGAILLANLMVASGIKSWKVRLNAGMTPQGPHAYVTYYSRKGWILLDWTRPARRQLYQEPWFSWNKRYGFSSKENIEKWRV